MPKCSVCGTTFHGDLVCPVCGMKAYADIEAFRTLMPAKDMDAQILLKHRKEYLAAKTQKQKAENTAKKTSTETTKKNAYTTKTSADTAKKTTESAAQRKGTAGTVNQTPQKNQAQSNLLDIYKNLASCFTDQAVVYGGGGQPLGVSMRAWAAKTITNGDVLPENIESVVAISSDPQEKNVSQGIVFARSQMVWINVKSNDFGGRSQCRLDMDTLASITMKNLRACRFESKMDDITKYTDVVFPKAVDLRAFISFMVRFAKERCHRTVTSTIMDNDQLLAYRNKQKGKSIFWFFAVILFLVLIVFSMTGELCAIGDLDVESGTPGFYLLCFLALLSLINSCKAFVRYTRSV